MRKNKENKPNKYLAMAISDLLIKHLDNKSKGIVTDDPDLEKLKDYILYRIFNNTE